MRRLKIKKSLIHALARCCVCQWQDENYLTAQKQSAKHVHQTGHVVQLELGYLAEYSKRTKP